MAANLDLYEALKNFVGEDAARMIAERIPLTAQLATKADLHAMEARIFRWMLGFFATLWLGNAGLIVTILLKF